MNTASFMGYLSYEPELKQSNSGTTYLRNAIRVRSRKKNEMGKTIYDEIPFTAFGQTAEQMCKFFHRGSPLLVTGSMSSNTYELTVKNSSNNGFAPRKITSVTLTVSEFEFVPRDNTSNETNANELDGSGDLDPYTNPEGLPY